MTVQELTLYLIGGMAKGLFSSSNKVCISLEDDESILCGNLTDICDGCDNQGNDCVYLNSATKD